MQRPVLIPDAGRDLAGATVADQISIEGADRHDAARGAGQKDLGCAVKGVDWDFYDAGWDAAACWVLGRPMST
jgi:hypothetical protein